MLDTKRIVYRIFDQLKCHGELFVCGVRFFVETSEELLNGLVRPGVCRHVVLGLGLPETFGLSCRQQQLADSLAGLPWASSRRFRSSSACSGKNGGMGWLVCCGCCF